MPPSLCGGADAESNANLDTPFSSQVEYAELLGALGKSFPCEMGNRGKSDRALMSVLQRGASYRHYFYRQNGALYLSSHEPDVRKLTPTGETANRHTPLASLDGSYVKIISIFQILYNLKLIARIHY